MGEILQVNAYLEKVGSDGNLENLSSEERINLEKLLKIQIQLASSDPDASFMAVTLQKVEDSLGGFLLDHYQEAFSWTAEAIRNNPKGTAAILATSDVASDLMWSALAMATGKSWATAAEVADGGAQKDYGAEYAAGAKSILEARDDLGQGTEALQASAIEYFYEVVKNSDLSQEEMALYATIAASAVLSTYLIAKRIKGGEGKSPEIYDQETEDLAGTFETLRDAIGKVPKKLDSQGGGANGRMWTGTDKLTSPQNAFKHWGKHKSEFPELQNSVQYVTAAKKFLQKPPSGTLTKTRSNGDVLRFDPATNTFGVMAKDGTPRTMFRPKKGIEYWNRQ